VDAQKIFMDEIEKVALSEEKLKSIQEGAIERNKALQEGARPRPIARRPRFGSHGGPLFAYPEGSRIHGLLEKVFRRRGMLRANPKPTAYRG
jgi:hypothetical protein